MQEIINSGLRELLENHLHGLIWTTRSLEVQYANSRAKRLLGAVASTVIEDPDLVNAVADVVAGGAPRVVATMGAANGPGGISSELRCRVIRGLKQDDAFILVTDPNAVDASAAMDDLMVVLRSDLHSPLHWVEQALRLAREDHCDGHTIDALAERVEALAQATRSLMDFASIWTGGSSIANDRIELLHLLRKAWAEAEPLAIDHRIKVRFRTHAERGELATVYGSESWLHRVLVECLEAAVRAAVPGSSLDIVHRQLGTRASIVFRDCEAFSDGQDSAESIEMRQGGQLRNRALRMVRLPAREHIALKLCQHVLRLHGGQLRSETVDGQRNLIVDIPTGAPYRQSRSSLDIEQAQQYALDLVEVMSRARQNSISLAINH